MHGPVLLICKIADVGIRTVARGLRTLMPMAHTVGDFLVARLSEWGVTRIYGYPGDGINGILGALARAADHMRFIQVRHEEMAAFMACAHAKFSGEVGVCLATSGPGAIHLLNGLYDAQMDHQPVVAIVGQSARAAIGGSYQQEVDLLSLFKDVAHEYVHVASVPEQFPHLVDRAMRIAKVERTVTCIIIPNDLQELDAVKQPPHLHGTVHSGTGICFPRVIPRDSDLQRAADLLNRGSKVAILVGAGDGAMQMNGLNELITIAKYWPEWTDPRLVVLVLNNRDLNMVTWEQRALAGNPKFEASQNLPDFPYADYARTLGLDGVRVDKPEQIGPAWDRAFSSDRPFVIDAVTDPNVPPLPPHISLEQAKSFTSSVLKGDAEALGFLKQTFKDLAAAVKPGRQ